MRLLYNTKNCPLCGKLLNIETVGEVYVCHFCWKKEEFHKLRRKFYCSGVEAEMAINMAIAILKNEPLKLFCIPGF